MLQRQTDESPQRLTESETQSENDTPPGTDTLSEPELPPKMPDSIKIPKPDKFDAKDMSIAIIIAWIFSVEEYMKLAKIPVVKQTRLAAAWLIDIAKIWYINIYKDIKSFFSLEVFLKVFKK